MRIQHSQKGFTLLESLVAISILLIAVVGPMSIIGRSLPQSAYARDHAIAVNLAQEGIEAVRQKRDSNMLDKWNGGLSLWDSGLSDGYYIVDPRASPMLYFCGVAGCASDDIVRRDIAGWRYQSTGSTDPNVGFRRIILISTISAHEKQVMSTVYWFDSSQWVHLITELGYISAINS